MQPATDLPIRIGGLVEKGSLKHQKDNWIAFTITDGKATVAVMYQGLLPNLFREGQGVVAEGLLATDGHFNATNILAKHDENYMPPEVADALKKSGRWREGEPIKEPEE
jgi:cytochrome c-type biogenesis protein CcmE